MSNHRLRDEHGDVLASVVHSDRVSHHLGEDVAAPLPSLDDALLPRLIELLFQDSELSFLADNGTKMVLPVTEATDKSLRDEFAACKIPVRANYSCEEFGWIGAECAVCPETYHVTESNVIVEIDKHKGMLVDGVELGRVLVTHLHSYATPFVRYDIGDFARLSEQCPCGHDGPVLSKIYGQKKRLLKRANGTVVPLRNLPS